jgi:hypothetical protein
MAFGHAVLEISVMVVDLLLAYAGGIAIWIVAVTCGSFGT